MIKITFFSYICIRGKNKIMFFVNMNNISHTHDEIERLLYKSNNNDSINKNRLKEYFLLLDEEPAKREHIYKDYIVYV